MSITNTERQLVRERANHCCEYCRIAQANLISKFQIDHIIPLKHNGLDDTNNLCLACLKCNGYKGPNVAALDPHTDEATKLYNPRQQQWADHFRINSDATLSGLSPEGRATINVLRINDEERVKHRQVLMTIGDYPC